MMKKNRLVASFDFDFSLLAIVSHLKEYKMAWQINQELGINLVKQEDEIFEFLGDIALHISNYKYQTTHNVIRLLVNRSLEEANAVKQHLVPELKQFDYLMLLDGTEFNSNARSVRNRLKKLEGIQLINVIKLEQLKSKENLIF